MKQSEAKYTTVYQGRLLHCLTKETVLPNGHTVKLEIVKHPGAVLMVPFLNRTTVLLLKQYRAVIEKYIYEFPAGTLEAGEKTVTCARRELIEETGYAARKFTPLGKIYPVPGYSTEVIYLYKAEQLRPVPQDIQDDEVIIVKQFSCAQVRALVKKGEIVDAKTICALALCGIL